MLPASAAGAGQAATEARRDRLIAQAAATLEPMGISIEDLRELVTRHVARDKGRT